MALKIFQEKSLFHWAFALKFILENVVKSSSANKKIAFALRKNVNLK